MHTKFQFENLLEMVNSDRQEGDGKITLRWILVKWLEWNGGLCLELAEDCLMVDFDIGIVVPSGSATLVSFIQIMNSVHLLILGSYNGWL